MEKDSPIVFVVDDDPSVRRALSRLIRASGFSVQTFASADDFLARRRKDRPQCLVLDLRLTDMSGIELQRRLADSQENLPIIFITGYGTQEIRRHAMRLGAIDFLSKPFDENVLLEAIRRALSSERRVGSERSANRRAANE